jgi:hypothetical protein
MTGCVPCPVPPVPPSRDTDTVVSRVPVSRSRSDTRDTRDTPEPSTPTRVNRFGERESLGRRLSRMAGGKNMKVNGRKRPRAASEVVR